MKEKGLYRDTMGVHKGKSSETPSHAPCSPPQIEKKKQNTQSATAGSKKKNKETPMLHPEARISLKEVLKQLCKLLQHVLLFRCPGSWNPADGAHSLLLLEKEWLTSTSTSSPTLLSQSWSNFRTFLLQVTLPTPKRLSIQSCTTSLPTTNSWLSIFCSNSHSVLDNVDKIHSLGKNIHKHFLPPSSHGPSIFQCRK